MESKEYYWNSNTRFNVKVEIIGENGDMYAIKSRGHVYVVPKANITPREKILETIAPKPEPWFVALTVSEFLALRATPSVTLIEFWYGVSKELRTQEHTARYTREWFSLSSELVETILRGYGYAQNKYLQEFSEYLPQLHFKPLVEQLWVEKRTREAKKTCSEKTENPVVFV